MKAAGAALLAAASLLASACAAVAPRPEAGPTAHGACRALFEAVDAVVEREGVRDAQAARIPGFPYLRVDRLLASFRYEVRDEGAVGFWLARLARLDAEGRNFELDNLPAAAREHLDAAAAAHGRPLPESLDRCRERLLDEDARDPARLDVLRAAAHVPDDYSTARRVVGLYALTRLPFAAGVRAFEGRVREVFALPLERLPSEGQLGRFAPHTASAPSRQETARLIAAAASNPLRIPYPGDAAIGRLAMAHAPILEIDVAHGDDRIGAPFWPAEGPARVDTGQPRLFYRAAHARVGDEVLLQLVYTAWFPARPRSGPLDLLGGHLDALIWRVTLAPNGEPLVFDTIHGCGCYHFFFPTPHMRARPRPDTLDEWLFVPQELPRQGEDERAVLRLASGTHYLQRVRFENRGTSEKAASYRLAPDNRLRSLPRPDGTRRSLYGPEGFVAGTERRERFLFWPMGVKNPGAMRQWGRHATAFVGRRHFDEPRLMDERFEIREALDSAPTPAAPGPLP